MNISSDKLYQFTFQVSRSAGMGEREAHVFADSLVQANLRGMDSHGVMRLGAYLRRIREDVLFPGQSPEILSDGGSLLTVDGKNGVGVWIAQQVMELCVERAGQTGVCIAGVRHGNHFGCASYFTRWAMKHHMIGFAMANSPKAVAPFGGAQAMFGTNPLAVAIPARGGVCFDLDMATSLVAQGKLILARKEGRRVPLGWGLDADGKESTDPAAILDGGTLSPFGGAKGYAITLMIELLCVCLAGGSPSTTMGSMYGHPPRPQDTGFVIGAIDYSRVMSAEDFESAAGELIESIKNSRKAAGVEEIYAPGELEQRRSDRAEANGIALSDAVCEELTQIGALYSVPFPAA